MRCIFPCLQLIYFYMDVGYHDVLFFFSLLFGRSETLVLHCLCPAETDGDRQSTKTKKNNKKKFEAGQGPLSKREGVILFKNRSSGFFVKVCYLAFL